MKLKKIIKFAVKAAPIVIPIVKKIIKARK